MAKKKEWIDLDPKMKTFLIIECSDDEFRIRYTGSMDFPKIGDKKTFKHDQRIITMLASDKKTFDLLYRLVEPARKFYQREAKRALKDNTETNKG